LSFFLQLFIPAAQKQRQVHPGEACANGRAHFLQEVEGPVGEENKMAKEDK
jgi:hypothetical protein